MRSIRETTPECSYRGLYSQYSPSNRYEPKSSCKMFHLRRGKGFRECIRHHLVGRAIDKSNLSLFNDPTDKMITDVDVFRASVILMLLCERDCRLIVREKCSCRQRSSKELKDEGTKP